MMPPFISFLKIEQNLQMIWIQTTKPCITHSDLTIYIELIFPAVPVISLPATFWFKTAATDND